MILLFGAVRHILHDRSNGSLHDDVFSVRVFCIEHSTIVVVRIRASLCGFVTLWQRGHLRPDRCWYGDVTLFALVIGGFLVVHPVVVVVILVVDADHDRRHRHSSYEKTDRVPQMRVKKVHVRASMVAAVMHPAVVASVMPPPAVVNAPSLGKCWLRHQDQAE